MGIIDKKTLKSIEKVVKTVQAALDAVKDPAPAKKKQVKKK